MNDDDLYTDVCTPHVVSWSVALQYHPGWPMTAATRATQRLLRSYEFAGSTGEDPDESLGPPTARLEARLRRLRGHVPAEPEPIQRGARVRLEVRANDGNPVIVAGQVLVDTLLGWPRNLFVPDHQIVLEPHRALLIAPQEAALPILVWADRILALEQEPANTTAPAVPVGPRRLGAPRPADLDRIIPWRGKHVRVEALVDGGEPVMVAGRVLVDTLLGWPRALEGEEGGLEPYRALLIAPAGDVVGVWVWAEQIITIEEEPS